jgi:hypothetical protein
MPWPFDALDPDRIERSNALEARLDALERGDAGAGAGAPEPTSDALPVDPP